MRKVAGKVKYQTLSMSIELKGGLFQDFFNIGLVKFASIPLGVILSVIIARYLGPESFGQYAFVMAIVSIVSLPLAGGINQLVTREIAKTYLDLNWAIFGGLVRAANFLLLIVSCTIFVLAIFLAYQVPDSYKQSALAIALLIVPVMGLIAIKSGIIKGLGHPVLSEIPSLLVQPLTLLLLLQLLVPPSSPHAVIAMQVVSAVTALIFVNILYAWVGPKLSLATINRYLLRKWSRASLSFSLISMISVLNAEVGTILLSLIREDTAVAAMRVGERCAQLVALPLVLVNLIMGPRVVELYGSDDIVGLQDLSKKFSRLAFFLALPIGLTLIIFGEPILMFAFGVEYSGIAYAPMAILVSAQLVNVFFGSVGLILAMCGYEAEVLRCQFFSILINSFLCITLIPQFNAIGGAVSAGIAIVAWNVLMSVRLKKLLQISSTAI